MGFEEQQQQKMQRAISLENADFDDPCPRYLPEEIFLENILTRLPARDVARYSCVCKLWYNYTFKDSKFASSHFIRNKNKLNLVFNLCNVSQKAYLFTLEKDEFDDTTVPLPTSKKRKRDDDDDEKFLSYRHLGDFDFLLPCELVGYCNGLACFKPVSRACNVNGAISIHHPIRAESLILCYLTPTQSTERLCNYLCHGFGFDSLSEEYKVVIIFTTTPSVKTTNHQEFVCMVVTLGGSNSWRKIVISTSEIKPPPGYSSFPSSMVTTASRVTRKSATICGGDLFWWITNTTGFGNNKNKFEMLLSFDIHNEKLQFVRLPTDQCSLTPSFTVNDQQYLVVDYHLLEFKGYPCVVRSETLMLPGNSSDRCHFLRRCTNKSSSCSVKVHLYLLKDRIEQVWIEEEMFDVQLKEKGTLPAALSSYFDTTSTKPPPTRMLSFNDQLLLYWFDGRCLVLYNLQMKQIKVVKCSNKWYSDIFESKVDGDPPGYFPYMDYQLHAQPENILSLKTFIREEETRKFVTSKDFFQTVDNEGRTAAGWLYMARESVEIYSFD